MQPAGGQPPGRPPHCGLLYPPGSGGHGLQSHHRLMRDFSLGNVSAQVTGVEAGEGLGVR